MIKFVLISKVRKEYIKGRGERQRIPSGGNSKTKKVRESKAIYSPETQGVWGGPSFHSALPHVMKDSSRR